MRRVRIGLVILLLVAVVILLLRLRPGVEVKPGSVLVVDLAGEYFEGPEPPLLGRLLGRRGRPLVSLLSEFAKVERDPRIEMVLLRMGALQVGWAKAHEIRAATSRLREKGRRVVALLELERYGSNHEYFIASAANEIYLTPATRSPFAGLAAEYLFLGGLFEKLGVQMEYERVGRYKSAVEAYAEKAMSPSNREMANALLDSFESQFVAAVAEGRSLSPTEVRSLVDAAPTTAQEIVQARLADGIGYYEEVLEALGTPPVVKAQDYARLDPAELGFEPQATLALIYGAGPVVTGEGTTDRRGNAVLTSRTVSEALIEAAEDPEIDAIVFRIDSPGGSALASDLVWHATREVKKKGKPLIASFSDLAASGGYYVAAGADTIVSGPTTLTGSIGAYVLRPVLGGLLEKLGIGVEGLTRGKHAELYLSSRPLSPGTRERLRADVESVYQLFVARVAEGRSLDPEVVNGVGQGRVWTGEQALARGLVDTVGGLRVAALEARKALGLPPEADVALVPYPPPKPLAEQLRELLNGGATLDLLPELEGLRPLGPLAGLLEAIPPGSPALVPPFLLEVR